MENYVEALQNVIQNMQNEIAALRAERSIPQVQAALSIPPPDRITEIAPNSQLLSASAIWP
ncbi:hypothetical protein BATDEDRAFT_91527 [Batrachochytrium dendrobatidis JAM81]|uniref:Uncharacterized protein n=1 Tax=Batrachochytrium dendrobatidis (strain JAM81 / FGSC 10211) TaxID=684364 RepID=F4PAG1_BATDJ|nr:uncharacterized protein BATDEDRAFT_91527 [Batrachochytrium dendrobatidis JAM81]EGF77679.1 hypothetical protein BATDEDRAFT_91527 [Batrachochytrium dendrobatidis JAM81]|eukprot:XP_006681800.1 hypothetical protein BATDEDRAFT_91527 [Batrachochytrium dendrobatidis JAM81]